MTSTIPSAPSAGAQPTVPDTGLVLRRTDRAWRRDNADEPAPEGYLESLTAAVVGQVVEPLAAGGAVAVDPAAAAELHTLREKNTELTEQVTRLRADANGRTSALAELDQVKRALADANTSNSQLQGDLEARSSELTAARAEIETLSEQATAHQHYYPWIEGTPDAGPCACGRPYPRTVMRERAAQAPPRSHEPIDVLFRRVRRELPNWPAT